MRAVHCSPRSGHLVLAVVLHAIVPFLANGFEPQAELFLGWRQAGSGAWALPLAVPHGPGRFPSYFPPVQCWA